MYKYVKRLLDIIFSLILAIPLVFIYIVVGLLIKLEDGGPVIHKGARIGKDCKKYYMYKFRSMKVNAEDIRNADGSTYNSKDDKRVTKIGKILRETSIDELPQIMNVLLGHMSFVGPRAGLWEMLDGYMPDEMGKMKVKPGITGYTQAYYRNSMPMREKRLKDAWYAENVSFLLDVKILFKTVATVLKRDSIYTNGKGE